MNQKHERSVDRGLNLAAKPDFKERRRSLLGAMFLMATAAVGPGFIVQTATFTDSLGLAFGFAILVSVLVDIAVQLNVWRVISVSRLRVQDLANEVVPGGGYLLAIFIFLGALVFNIGNVAGTGLGGNVIANLPTNLAAAISVGVAILIFAGRRAKTWMDRIVLGLGITFLVSAVIIMVRTEPPYLAAASQSIIPETVDFFATVTLIGGTIGGYAIYAGAHRLIDAGIGGTQDVRSVSRVSVGGVIVTGVARALLYLAFVGAAAKGISLLGDLPGLHAFEEILGAAGRVLFGLIVWIAAITSVIGAAYTTISFIKTLFRGVARHENKYVVGMMVLSLTLFLIFNQAPASLLIFTGTVNGLILPIGFAVIMYVPLRRKDLLGDYQYPRWLLILGTIMLVLTIYMGVNAIQGIGALFT